MTSRSLLTSEEYLITWFPYSKFKNLAEPNNQHHSKLKISANVLNLCSDIISLIFIYCLEYFVALVSETSFLRFKLLLKSWKGIKHQVLIKFWHHWFKQEVKHYILKSINLITSGINKNCINYWVISLLPILYKIYPIFKSLIFYDVLLCSTFEVSRNALPPSSRSKSTSSPTPKIEAVCTSVMLENFYHTTCHHIPEDSTLQSLVWEPHIQHYSININSICRRN
jgi:hypothetical protein